MTTYANKKWRQTFANRAYWRALGPSPLGYLTLISKRSMDALERNFEMQKKRFHTFDEMRRGKCIPGHSKPVR